MTVRTRRDLLRAGAALAALAALPGCDRFADLVAARTEPFPERLALPDGTAIDPAFHLLSRAALGARPGDVDRVRAMGRAAWIDEQLAPESIDDTACDLRAAACESCFEHPQDLRSVEPEVIERDLARLVLLRAVHSRRRLFETMCVFWSDHFSIQTAKRGCRETKPTDDRLVVRRHALGRFRDLVRASALSPAMLLFLDGAENRRRTPDERPNENYARELLELHTLGVHRGYTQRDVMEAARCLTGWTLEDRGLRQLAHAGETVFRPEAHDDGEKVVLGTTIPAGGGERDLDRLLDVVCAHPATSRHVAWKLCRRFVADVPPEPLVESTAGVFRQTQGDVRAVVRHVLTSAAFEASAGARTKRPFEFVVSAMRSLGADCRATDEELAFLDRLGHRPFHHPTPDGYPDEPEPWMGTLLWRWNFAVALTTGRLGATRADLVRLSRSAGIDAATASAAELAPLLYGRAATAEERAAIDAFAARPGGDAAMRRAESVALLLCAPAFQGA